jgi:hypothetical protein
MQQIWLALLVGLILGWVIEWLIDWRYWRRSVAALRAENAELRRQLAVHTAAHPAPTPDIAPAPGAAAATAPGQQVE